MMEKKERRKRYYYYQDGEIKNRLMHRWEIVGSRFETPAEAKKFGLNLLARQMNNLLNALQEYVKQRKKLEQHVV